MREESKPNRWQRLKTFAGVIAAAFAVTLALVVGNRLSTEALGVLAGAVCGVGAAIPTSLLIVAVTRGRSIDNRAREASIAPSHRQGTYPPVVIINPGQDGQYRGYDQLPDLEQPRSERSFTIVGDGYAD